MERKFGDELTQKLEIEDLNFIGRVIRVLETRLTAQIHTSYRHSNFLISKFFSIDVGFFGQSYVQIMLY